MSLTLKIARRYLFSRKYTNAIHLITGISILGMTVGTAALILIMSVFNGFEDLLKSLYSNFNPDIRIEAASGKFFDEDPELLAALSAVEGVDEVAQSVEFISIFEYDDSQDIGVLKGVSENYNLVSGIDNMIRSGEYFFEKDGLDYLVLGYGLGYKLDVYVDNKLTSRMNVYTPRNNKGSIMSRPYKTKRAFPAGKFAVQEEYDNRYMLSSLSYAQSLMSKKNKLSAYEISLKPGIEFLDVKESVELLTGEKFLIKNRFEQQAAYLRIMNIEKLLGFALLSLTLVLVAFNMVGALLMVVLAKQKDIAVLKAMGATDGMIWRIFLLEGILMSGIGLVIGLFLAISLYFVHKGLPHGLISLSQGFVQPAYPASLRLSDILMVSVTVLFIGGLAGLIPANKARKVSAKFSEL